LQFDENAKFSVPDWLAGSGLENRLQPVQGVDRRGLERHGLLRQRVDLRSLHAGSSIPSDDNLVSSKK
jgi:hypothetical protein